MQRDFNVIHNRVSISSIEEFMDKNGSWDGRKRDVFFSRMIGMDGKKQAETERMDQVLASRMKEGRGFYCRKNALPRLSDAEDAAFYSHCYEDWIRGGKQRIGTRVIATDKQLAEILGKACGEALDRMGKGKAGLSSSIEKNFVVKLLFWLDATVPEALQNWEPGGLRKAVFGNISRKQEYLFCYLLTLLGFDVLLLQASQDIDAESEGLGLSKKMGQGRLGQFSLPEFPGAISQSRTPAVVNIRIPERDRRTEEMVQQAKGRTGTGAGKRTAAPVQTGGAPRAGMPSNRIVLPPRAAGRRTDVGRQRRELNYEELAMLASSVVLILIHDTHGKTVGSGSGIMIGREGFILTNSHVACGGSSYSVRIEDDDQVYQTDEMIKYNSVLDLAVIRIQRKLNPIPIYHGSQKLVRGQKVVAIGSPLGLFNSVSDGIISGFRVIDNVDMIQFTAPISHGSSGGAVLNMYGEVIGISTAGIDSGQNINLAIGYEYIQTFVQGFQ